MGQNVNKTKRFMFANCESQCILLRIAISQVPPWMASTQGTDADIELIIEKLSTNGTEELERSYVKRLKAYCKSVASISNQDEAYNHLGRLVLHQLEKKHAQIRYGSLLVIEYLFERSHQFRLFICEHLNAFFELCFDIKGFKYATTYDDHFQADNVAKTNQRSKTNKNTLHPVAWAKKLRAKAIECFIYWHNEFGSGYQTLKNGYCFLEQKGVIETGRIGGTASSLTRQHSSNADQSSVQKFQFERISKEFEDIENDINALTTQIDTCFDLLIPKFKVIEECEESDNFRFRPMQGLSFSIILNTKVEITRDSSNADLIDTLKELCGELNNIYRGKLSQFDDNVANLKLPLFADKVDEIISNTKCLKVKIGTIVWKFNEINIISVPNSDNCESNKEPSLMDGGDDEEDDNEGSDDEFEDVPDREDLYLMKKIEVEKAKQANEAADQIAGPSTSKNTVQLDENHCRAALPSGRLCPRRDKVRCPFHGPIISRNSEGLPIDADLKQRELDAKFQQKADEWKDPKYLKQLSIETGRDLEGKSLRNKRKKYPNLIDIKKLENTPRKRLMRKISSKKIREKISSDLTALDEQAHRQFSEQWSYSLVN